jgi:hypothetical protein
MSIGGATLAAAAMWAGLIDEYMKATHPVLVGGGTPFITALDSWVNLNLVETRTFPGGVVLTRYETRRRARRSPLGDGTPQKPGRGPTGRQLSLAKGTYGWHHVSRVTVVPPLPGLFPRSRARLTAAVPEKAIGGIGPWQSAPEPEFRGWQAS